MRQRSFRAIFLLLTLLSYMAKGESATVARIAFIKDDRIRTKCTADKHEILPKPIVLMRLAKIPLNDGNQLLSMDDEYADVDEENDEPTEQGQYSYTLIELSKTQAQNLINKGKLKLVHSGSANKDEMGIKLYNANGNDLIVEDGDFVDEDEDLNDDDNDLNDEDDSFDYEDGRSKRRPWRKVQRVIRRQLIKRPRRYFNKIVRRVG